MGVWKLPHLGGAGGAAERAWALPFGGDAAGPARKNRQRLAD